MTVAVEIARDLTAAGFVALGLAIAYRWYRYRGHAQGVLALALVSLAGVAALGRVWERPPAAVSVVEIVLFMLSGYFVLLFRNEFIPLGSATLQAANVLLGFSIVIGALYVTLFGSAAPVVRTLLALEVVTAWAILTGEPIVRFWLASNSLPAVQKARLRFLSFGFAVLIVVLLAAVLGGSALQSPAAIIAIQVLALVTVPAIYVSFAPPSLLRRIWRMGEEGEVRGAMQDLLIFSPTRQVLAERGSFWAVRLLGAKAGFIVDPDGNVIAATGIDRDDAAALAKDSESVVRVPLHLPEGLGFLVVVGGPFTPVFGSEEIAQLNAYAVSVSAGLQRARVTERMAQIEKNKSEFLNLASHELRGPITVIRGYVSMLQSGLLGHLNERGQKAASVMAAKVLEMNEVIEEMIESARLEEGAVALRRVETDLRDVARGAAEIVAPLMDAKHRLVMDLPDRRVRVNLDPERTKTIIANLLSNAIKYSPDGGAITCEVHSRNGIAKVAVTDQGLGIAERDLGTLFTRFGRVITPETEHLKGTGLGLFLGRQLARLQGGDIAVVSVEGTGSTFTLQLPTGMTAEHVRASVRADTSPA